MDAEAGAPPESESTSPTQASNQYLQSWEGKIDKIVQTVIKPAALGSLLITVVSLAYGNAETTIAAGLITAGLVWGSKFIDKEIASRTSTQPQGKP